MRLLITLLLLVSGSGQDPAGVMDRAAKAGFSGAVLAVRNGQPVLERAYGRANPATGAPFTIDTAFSIASVTKQFTRAAILILEEQGRLSLSDSITRHLPELPGDKSAITLQHLFDMQSGLHEYHETGDDNGVPGDHQPMTQAQHAAIPGLSHASPIVWGDRVYVISAVGGSALDRTAAGANGVIFATRRDPA
ncbi:MAG: beta-lactamase family protein [Acidobacteriota bacterium]|nr:beta-lactamase family protein [Acidobacteriota bacterium]